jgi:hypothetical protein
VCVCAETIVMGSHPNLIMDGETILLILLFPSLGVPAEMRNNLRGISILGPEVITMDEMLRFEIL